MDPDDDLGSDLGNPYSSDSFNMPSDPHARADLLMQLQAAFPSLRIPKELQASQPPQHGGGAASAWSAAQGVVRTPTAEHSPTESPRRAAAGAIPYDPAVYWGPALAGAPPPSMFPAAPTRVLRVESSIDLDSPRGDDPDAPFLALPSHTSAWLEAEHQRIARQVADGVAAVRSPQPQHSPWRAAPPAGAALYTPAPRDGGGGSDPAAQKQTFYDKLGRQLTALLLDSGTPLPRGPVPAATPAGAAGAGGPIGTPQSVPRGGGGGALAGGAHPQPPGPGDEKALAAAEMFLHDYYAQKARQAQLEQKLRDSESENLALRSQLDIAVAKMMAAQKETDRYAEYFAVANADASQDKSDQVTALMKSLKDMSNELLQCRQEKETLAKELDTRVATALEDALVDQQAEATKLKAQLREKKKMIKEMKLILFSYLSNNDPADMNPKMAFMQLAGGQEVGAAAKLQAALSPGVAM